MLPFCCPAVHYGFINTNLPPSVMKSTLEKILLGQLLYPRMISRALDLLCTSSHHTTDNDGTQSQEIQPTSLPAVQDSTELPFLFFPSQMLLFIFIVFFYPTSELLQIKLLSDLKLVYLQRTAASPTVKCKLYIAIISFELLCTPHHLIF